MTDTETPAPQVSFVLPTSTAVARYMQLKVESVLNTPYQVTDELTPYEHVLTVSHDAKVTADLLNLPEQQAEIAIDLLEEALDGGAIEDAYGLRGGVLNVLLPMASEDLDLGLDAVLDEEDGAPTIDKFANTPNELFSSLTPAQVWVGTGPIEAQLADALLPRLWAETRELSFPTPGAANAEWLSRLRLWSYNPAGGGRGRVIDLIVAERNMLLEKRVTICHERGIDIEFLPNL